MDRLRRERVNYKSLDKDRSNKSSDSEPEFQVIYTCISTLISTKKVEKVISNFNNP